MASTVERMRSARYNPDTGEVVTPMDVHTAEITEGDTDLDLAEQEGKATQKNPMKTQEQSRPDPNFLQKHLKIHDDNMVSTFREVGVGNSTVGSLSPSRNFNPIPSNVTPSTLFQSTPAMVNQEMIQMITEKVLKSLRVSQVQQESHPNPSRRLYQSPDPGRAENPPGDTENTKE